MKKLLTLVLSVLAFNGALLAQPTTPPAARPALPTLPKITLPADLQALIQKFDAQRDVILAQRRADLEKLKNATAAERAKLLSDMKAKGMELSAEQRELARNIREELKKLRAARKTGGS
jgi:Skp family chaperone for outer membrane proteins